MHTELQLAPRVLKQRITLPICDKKNANIFKKNFCTVTDDLVANLLPPFLRFGLPSV